MDTNRTAASNDTASPALDLQQKYERLDRKHQDLKNLKQNLLEMIQNKEKEHKEEIETFQQRLEENKKSLREVEDENVSLRFEVADLKQRETHLVEKNKEIKALLRKYYNRVKAIENHYKGGQSYEASISAPSESVMSPSLQPPKFNFERRPSSKRGSQLHPVTECQDNSPTVSLKIPDKLTETYLNTSFDRSKERSHSFLDLRDRNGLGFRENSEPQDQSPGSRYIDLKLNRRDKSVTSIQNFQERSREESEDRWGMPKTSRNALRYSSPDEDSPIKIGRRPSSLRNRRPRSISLSWVEGRDYLYMFNTLSQNIVSLGVKPEISVNKFGILPVKQEDAPSDDAREKTTKTSMLRYVSKNSTEYLELHYQQTPKNKTFEGFEAYQKKKLFEDFLVIGVDKEDLKSFMKQHPEKKNAKLKPRILFKHPTEGSPDHEAAHNSIPDFAFPFGVQVHKLKSTPSFSSLNPIIYISSEGDQRTKCFMFPLLSGNLTDEAVKMGQVIEGFQGLCHNV